MDFNTQHIQQLLDKYWEGETTLQEETVLKQYFNTQQDIPATLQPFQSLFQYYKEAAKETLATNISVEEITSSSRKTTATIRSIGYQRKKWYTAISAAAAIALLLISVWWMQPMENQEQALTKAEKIEAKKAYEKTKAALMLVSSKLNHGAKVAATNLQVVQNLERKKLSK